MKACRWVFGLGKPREVVKGEGIEHHESPRGNCGAEQHVAEAPEMLTARESQVAKLPMRDSSIIQTYKATILNGSTGTA
jgi:hypothetical protein